MKSIKTSLLLLVAIICFCYATSTDKKLQKRVVKTLNENYAFVPSGNIVIENDSIAMQSFIMFKTEVSNVNYIEFLDDLKRKGEDKKYQIARIDSTLWSHKNNLNAAYQEHYHKHPAYRDYPVVNISKEGAELYCEWLTERINASLAFDKKIIFRLPTHAEWMYAAHGGLEKNVYPWGGPYLRNSEGSILCNFTRLDATSIGRDSSGSFKVFPVPSLMDFTTDLDITAPVKSYWSNGYDIYNMSGNVAEMVADKDIIVGGSWNDPGYDVRIASQKPYTGASRTTGFRMVATVVPSENEWLKVPKRK